MGFVYERAKGRKGTAATLTHRSGALSAQSTTTMTKPKIEDLHMAIRAGNLELVNHFAKLYADDVINSSKFSFTALGLAVQQKRHDMVESLLDNGADVNKYSKDANGRLETPLFTAVRLGCKDIVKALLETKASINATDFYNTTPLWQAVKGRNFDIAKTLTEHNCDLNYGDKKGLSPLHLAVKYPRGRQQIIRLLISHGSSVTARDAFGADILLTAVRSGQVETVDALLRADVSISNAVREHLKEVREHSADLDEETKEIADRINLALVSTSPKSLCQFSVSRIRAELIKSARGVSIHPAINQLPISQQTKDELKLW